MTVARMLGSAGGRVGRRDGERVLLDNAVSTLVMQVSIVQIVGVAVMLNGSVTAAGAVLMSMVGVDVRHDLAPDWGKPEISRGIAWLRTSPTVAVQLVGVRQRVGDQFGNVVVGQRIVDVLAGAPLCDDPFTAQQLQPL